MFKEQMNKIKGLIPIKKEKNEEEGEDRGKKRKIENLVVFLIILIVTLIAINSILGGDKDSGSKNDEDSTFKVLANDDEKSNSNYNDELEERLKNILETLARCAGRLMYL